MKQFAEWATALRVKYRNDLFFRTTLYVVLLQFLVVFGCVVAFWWTLSYTNERVLSSVVESIRAIVESRPGATPESLSLSVAELQRRSIAFVFVTLSAVAVVMGLVLARFTLKPARNTLRQQKLFISNVAHELRTPLSTIKTSTEVALLDDKLPPGIRRTLLEVGEELNRISEIINNLLSLNALSRPERMQFSEVNLSSLAEEVVQRLLPLARERGIRVTTRREQSIAVWGNATALEQVMTNLLKNALSYTPEGGKGMVTLTLRPDLSGMVLFSVSDNGIGISQEDLFHIFEPFYRADTSRVRRVRKSGTGLGLTIVNEMVRMHQGKIQIKSAKGKGTAVSVYLPQLTRGNDKDHSNTRALNEVSLDFSGTE